MAFWYSISACNFFLSVQKSYRQILLVGENQEQGIPELVLVQHALQLLAGLNDTVSIVAVDHEDDTLGVLEVVSPQGTDLVLSTDIPHGELDVLVLDGLDVESCTEVSALPGLRFQTDCVCDITEKRCSESRDGTDRSWGWW